MLLKFVQIRTLNKHTFVFVFLGTLNGTHDYLTIDVIKTRFLLTLHKLILRITDNTFYTIFNNRETLETLFNMM